MNNNAELSHDEMINTIISYHFKEKPKAITRIMIGICNEVYGVKLSDKEVIVRLSPTSKYLYGSHVHIPEFKTLGIKVPDLLAEDYTQTFIPLCYQIQSKIDGEDLGLVIESLSSSELMKLSHEIADIFKKVKTLPVTAEFGVIWGGDNDVSDSWPERMELWIKESVLRGKITGLMDNEIESIATLLYMDYKSYFALVKPTMYYGDICSKNVMIHKGAFNGLVDLDGLTQGDPLEALGRIRLSWFDTPFGDLYSNAIMTELALDSQQRRLVTMYALLNQISWTCENGIQFNQNTKPNVNWEKAEKDKALILKLAKELRINNEP